MARNKILLLSLAANAGFVGWFCLTGPQASPDSKAGSGHTEAAAQAPFAWSDLRSSDYATYISNLTKIGCPQRSIRAVIQSELDDSFAPRRSTFLANLARSDMSDRDRDFARTALQELDREKAQLLGQLFGTEPSEEPVRQSAPAAQPTGTPRGATQNVAADSAPAMPLVFRSVDTNQFNLSGDDLAIVERVRGDFLNQLGTNEDIASPEYLQSWQKGQKEADNVLSALLGRQAWLQYQQAAQQSEPASQ